MPSQRFRGAKTVSTSMMRHSLIERAARDLGDRYGAFDLVINATGALLIDGHSPEKTIKALSADAMMAQFRVNAIGPALLLKHFHSLLPRKTRNVFASLSARVGSISGNRLGGWISYRAAKAAQNPIIKTAALEIARTHPQAIVVALHPGTVATKLARPFLKAHQSVAPDYAAARLLDVIAKLGPSQSSGFYSYDGQQIEW
jgi:NAD(P)-dependent dehydrogenase (short-subunit alcohol dehydrogenase family)